MARQAEFTIYYAKTLRKPREEALSCMLKLNQGCKPGIFPLSIIEMDTLHKRGQSFIASLITQADPARVGATLRPDGTPFYLCTVAPDGDAGLGKEAPSNWKGAFFAPVGVGEIGGIVEALYGDPTRIKVNARLLVGGVVRVNVSWEVVGTTTDTVNNAAMIDSVTIHDHGPHDAGDIRRCIALHAPQGVFGLPAAVVAMQCGVAAACLVEAIC